MLDLSSTVLLPLSPKLVTLKSRVVTLLTINRA